jgi:hypothetical protein
MAMLYSDDSFRVEITTKECEVPPDERTRLQALLEPLRDSVRHFPSSNLWMNVVYHPRSAIYHVELKLKLPGHTLFAGGWDTYLDSTLQRSLVELQRKVAEYQQRPKPPMAKVAEQQTARARAALAPEDPAVGPLAEAAQAGDYHAFRTALSGYEEWLRKRVGRWVQRYPEAQDQVGSGLLLGDLIEEVYLNAFESFAQRSTDVRLSEWLDRLIDPSLKLLLRHPDEEKENVSLARTVREAPLG